MTQAGERSSILVIDDEFGPRESVRFLFKQDYDVICAASVDEGLEKIHEASPDVVILDIKMPGKTGIQGLREIRELDPLVSVVMLTGFGSLETAQEAIRLGATDYVTKPPETKELRDIVERYVGETRLARQRARTDAELRDLNQRLSEELESKEQLATLGQASSEFVHDLRSPLTIIYGYVQLLMKELEEAQNPDGKQNADTVEYLDIIQKNVRRCEQMARQWRDLGRSDPQRMRDVRIAELVEELVQSVEPLAQDVGARVVALDGPQDCVVHADPLQLFRALQNLAANGIQALPQKGGRVTIGWTATNGNMEIRIDDNGTGMDDAAVHNAFQPSFTTKESSGGMGLGLFITKRVIESLAGTVSLENKPEGDGVVATVRLPLS